MQTKAVIFDFDGVIIDSFDVIREIYQIIKEELASNTLDHVFESGDFFVVNWRDTLKQFGITDPNDVKRALEIYRRESERLRYKIKPFKGIKEVLEVLSLHYKIAIVSNGHSEIIKSLLKRFKLLDYFDSIIGAEQGLLKPDPTPFIMCLNQLNVKPEEAVYIGDMDGDVLAARNAKLKKAIAVTYGYHSEIKLTKVQPDIIISAPQEIHDAVK